MNQGPTTGTSPTDGNTHKLRFDGTFTFGHLMTLVSFFSVGVGFYVSTETRFAKSDARLEMLEKGQITLNSSMEKLAETQAMGMRNQDKISMALDYLSKERDGKDPR